MTNNPLYSPSSRISVPPVSVSRRWWLVKYAAEWLFALVGAIITSPLVLALMLLVKATSAGPALYISQRLGRRGRIFNLYKLRSMKVDSPLILGPDGKVITLAGDSRFTIIGRFLRVGFDELPQLFNVLKGDMCMVGPRPDVPLELDKYSEREKLRLMVLPGITGLAQVMNGRDLNNAKNYELDVCYIRDSSARMDIAIALLTIPYMLGFRRAGRAVFAREFRHLNTTEQ